MALPVRDRPPLRGQRAELYPPPDPYEPSRLVRLWPAWAACAGSPTATFYSTRPADRAHAEAVCGRCPVLDVCLWSCLAEEEAAGYHYGYRGGLSPAARAVVQSAIGSRGARPRLLGALEALSRSIHRHQAVAA